MTLTLDAALLCSSRPGSDLGNNLHVHITHVYDEYNGSITVPYKRPKRDLIHRQQRTTCVNIVIDLPPKPPWLDDIRSYDQGNLTNSWVLEYLNVCYIDGVEKSDILKVS